MVSQSTQASDAPTTLDEHGCLRSDLWLDQPDAHDRIDARLAAGSLTADDAARLHSFVDRGFLTTSIDLDAAAAAAIDADINRLWVERRPDLAISLPGPGGPQSIADYAGTEKVPGYRIPDLHGYSPHAMDLYLHDEIFRLVELVFDQPAIAFQSLYFEYGSAQGLHRDPMFVSTRPRAHLAAAWIALEDITPESGPLAYVPGSHLLPWFAFHEDSIALTHNVPQERRREAQLWMNEQMRERGLAAQEFTCRRGDVFIWHGGLVHGGRPIKDTAHTRKSFVVHYSTAANYRDRTARMQVRDGDGTRLVEGYTDVVVRSRGGRGLDSPMKRR